MIKNLLVLFCACFYFLNADAQIDKGAIYPELTIGKRILQFNTNSFQPGISIGLNRHTTLGVFYNHIHYNIIPSTTIDQRVATNRYGISYAYYSFFKGSKKWGWFLNGTASLNQISSYYKSGGGSAVNQKRTDFDLSVTPGIFFKPSSRIMFTANVGSLGIYNSFYPIGNARSSFGGELNLGMRINLFGKKK